MLDTFQSVFRLLERLDPPLWAAFDRTFRVPTFPNLPPAPESSAGASWFPRGARLLSVLQLDARSNHPSSCSKRERFRDPQPGAPQHRDQRAHPQAAPIITGLAHHSDEFHARRIRRVEHPLVARHVRTTP
jgi:hypothetical protein